MKRLARALLEANRCFAGTAVPYPQWHRVPPFKRPSGTRLFSITYPALKVPGYFQPSLPGRRAPKRARCLWDDCEPHLRPKAGS